jgi:hypothetical protein
MEHILRQGEIGLRQDLLIYGKGYRLWCDGKYIGIATYTEDPNIGDSFLKESKTTEGEDCYEVHIPDEWQFA